MANRSNVKTFPDRSTRAKKHPIMGVRRFDLLELAAPKKVPVVMLTARAVNPDNMNRIVARLRQEEEQKCFGR